MSKILHVDHSDDFATGGELGKSIMKETTIELESLISSLNLGSEKLPIEEFVQMAGEQIVDAQYNMVELVDLAWGGKFHLGLDLNEEQMEEQ